MKAYELLTTELFPLGITDTMRETVLKFVGVPDETCEIVAPIPEKLFNLYIAAITVKEQLRKEAVKKAKSDLTNVIDKIEDTQTANDFLNKLGEVISKGVQSKGNEAILSGLSEAALSLFWAETKLEMQDLTSDLVYVGIRNLNDSPVLVNLKREQNNDNA